MFRKKTRFWTIFRYFLPTHEIDLKFDEDHEYLVLLEVKIMEKSIAPQILGGNSISGYCPPERQYPHLAVGEKNCSYSRKIGALP